MLKDLLVPPFFTRARENVRKPEVMLTNTIFLKSVMEIYLAAKFVGLDKTSNFVFVEPTVARIEFVKLLA